MGLLKGFQRGKASRAVQWPQVSLQRLGPCSRRPRQPQIGTLAKRFYCAVLDENERRSVFLRSGFDGFSFSGRPDFCGLPKQHHSP